MRAAPTNAAWALGCVALHLGLTLASVLLWEHAHDEGVTYQQTFGRLTVASTRDAPTPIATLYERYEDPQPISGVLRELIEPGMRKCDLVGEIYRTAMSGTPEFGGDYAAFVPILATGADASAPHLTWDDKPFESGAGTFFEIAGAHRRYQLPLCRSVYLGTPPPAMLEAEKALIEGLEAGLEAARAGNRACDVANALYGTMEKYGIHKEGRCGYPIGISYPPDWGERTISFRPTDESILEPGMTFHFMPGLWMDDWGLEITESLLIRDEGPAETLANYPRELFVKP